MDHRTETPVSAPPSEIIKSKKEALVAACEEKIELYEAELQKRDITVRTWQYYEVLIEVTQKQLKSGDPDPQILSQFDTVHNYQQARAQDLKAQDQALQARDQELEECQQKLKSIDRYAKFADYAMVRCKRLMNVDGNFTFQKMLWHEIVEKLDAEDREFAEWEGSKTEAPQQRIRLELVSAMDILRETDEEQIFWEIRLYAKRNVKFHNVMLELKRQARYDELLLQTFEDERSVQSVLPKEELKDAGHYRTAIKRYREKYWDPIDTGDGPENWRKKAFVLAHEKAVREKSGAATEVPPKTPQVKTRQGLNRLETKLEEQAKAIGETRDMVQVIGNAAASSTKLNPAQKHALSKSFEDQDYQKRQHMSHEDTAALLPFVGGSENEMEVDEEGGDV